MLAPLHNRPALEADPSGARGLAGHPARGRLRHRVPPHDARSCLDVRRSRALARGVGRPPLRLPRDQRAVGRLAVDARRLVVAHLGGGCSVTAVLDGRSVDTTMGFSPLEGVPMATRSGSVDPGALVYLLREKRVTLDGALADALEHASGLAGLSGHASGDVRDATPLALDVFVHRVAGAIAAMAAACGGSTSSPSPEGSANTRTRYETRIVERVRFLGALRSGRRAGRGRARDRRPNARFARGVGRMPPLLLT